MHTVSQNKDKFTINNLFYCCNALIFTHPLVYNFLCGLIFMGHPVHIRAEPDKSGLEKTALPGEPKFF